MAEQSPSVAFKPPWLRRGSSTSTDSAAAHEEEEACLAAIQGRALPHHEQLREPLLLKAVIHGIRYHEGFARSPAVLAACADNAALARARHARLIMSNEVPTDMVGDRPDGGVKPYCIWHPQVATEATYRELARRYPDMRYQVGRACAVAGYARLYRELDLLPDVSIAEEARNCGGAESEEIFEDIVGRQTRFAVMNDYTREVNFVEPRAGACLNGDTAVRSSLDIRLDVRNYFRRAGHFDICEDGGIDDDTHARASQHGHNRPLAEEHVPLLYSPLPADLPAVANKDVLIQMAAYEGNVDRYSRLRRPFFIQDEVACIIRGIYHNTTFAKWWSLELKKSSSSSSPGGGRHHDHSHIAELGSINAAVTARFIMNNDLSRATVLPSYTPYLIWYPLWPRPETLTALTQLRPDMALQIAHACIVADYRTLYNSLFDRGAVKPNWILWREAQNHGGHGPYYVTDLERRAREMGFDVASVESKSAARDTLNIWCTNRDKEPSDNWLYTSLAVLELSSDQGSIGIYDEGVQANAAAYNLFICSPEQLRREVAEQSDSGMLYLYHEHTG